MEKETVTIRKCDSYDESKVASTLIKILEDLGGVDTFFKRGEKVLLKPNLLKDDPKMKGIITHPLIIREISKIALKAGCRVKIGDSPGYGGLKENFKKSGFENYFSDLDVELVEFRNPVEIKNQDGLFKRFYVDKEVLDCDTLINLPKAKAHGQMLITMAVKNMFGAVVGKSKAQWHLNAGVSYLHFAKMIVELHYLIKPTLNILDAVVGMEGEGPAAGDPVDLGFIAASRDALSLDLCVTRLLNLDSKKIYIFQAAKELGRETKLENILIKGDSIDTKKFKLPDIVSLETLGIAPWLGKFLKNALTDRPFIEREKCNLCSSCVNQCPARVMGITKSSKKDFVNIDLRNCIRCYCCQEICPQEAIRIRSGWLLKLFKPL